MPSGSSCSGGRGGRSRRRRWRCGRRIVLACADGASNIDGGRAVWDPRADGRASGGAGSWSAGWTGWSTSPGRAGRPRSLLDQVEEVVVATLEADADERHPLVADLDGASGPGCRRRRSGGSGGSSTSSRTCSDGFKLSTDPLFVEKVVDVVGLYHNPPEKAVVLCVDEKSQVQALDRSQPVLPMMPGMPERRTHDYVRHGITSLFAAFNIADGDVISEPAPPAPGDRVPQVPDHHRQGRPRRAGHPPRLRQLRHPQDRRRSTTGWPATPGSTSTSPRPDRPGSTRSNGSSACITDKLSAAASTSASQPSRTTSGNGSTPGTRTRDRSSGPRPPTRSSTPSAKYLARISGAGH